MIYSIMVRFTGLKTIDKDTIQFEVNNKDTMFSIPLANAIRRIMLTEIPTYAIDIDSIEWISNSSMLNDDYLTHRLGLIPINFEMAEKQENVVVELNLKNDSDQFMDVTLDRFKNKDLFVFPDIMFARLAPDQEIHLKCKLVKGVGNENFVLATTGTRYVFKASGENERDFPLNKMGDPETYQYTVEGIGQMAPKKIFLNAMMVLQVKLNQLKENLEQQRHDEVQVNVAKVNFRAMEFVIMNESHTLGALLQDQLMKMGVEYVGYDIPHPLDDFVKICLKADQDDAVTVFLKAVDNLNKIIGGLIKEWSSVSKKL